MRVERHPHDDRYERLTVDGETIGYALLAAWRLEDGDPPVYLANTESGHTVAATSPDELVPKLLEKIAEVRAHVEAMERARLRAETEPDRIIPDAVRDLERIRRELAALAVAPDLVATDEETDRCCGAVGLLGQALRVLNPKEE